MLLIIPILLGGQVYCQFTLPDLPDINLDPIPDPTILEPTTTTTVIPKTFTKTAIPTITLIAEGASFRVPPQDTPGVIKGVIVGSVFLGLILLCVFFNLLYKFLKKEKKIEKKDQQESQTTLDIPLHQEPEPVPKMAFYSLKRWTRVRRNEEPVVVQVDSYLNSGNSYSNSVPIQHPNVHYLPNDYSPVNYSQADSNLGSEIIQSTTNIDLRPGNSNQATLKVLPAPGEDFDVYTPRLSATAVREQDALKDDQLKILAETSSVVS